MLAESSAELSRKQYFWVQLALLVAGIVGLRLSHHVATWDAVATNATLWTTALVSASLIAVARSNYVIVTSAFSDAYRVFRFRHLLACSALIGSAAVVVGSLVVPGPFDQLLAHGRITGEAIADLGSVVATFVCSFGAVCASAGTWTALRDERHWDQSLHLRGHRPT
jgi:uncharacterized membrane protein YidH (DUF202 family)